MQHRFFSTVLLLCFATGVFVASAQDGVPDDYLTPAFHKGRRDAAREKMPANSVMVVFAAPLRTFSNDVEYLYHPNPDLYYFTGYKEPQAVLFLFKEPQKNADGSTYTEVFFVQKKDARSEQWTGRRLGTQGVKEKLGIETVYTGDDLKNFAQDFSMFSKFIMTDLPEDVKKSRNAGDLYNL